MTARYLIRLDDACHTMDRRKWQFVEQVLDQYGIKPIVAVIPDNQDPELMLEEPDGAFWDKVRAWQAKGWTIAMHGHTHVMHQTDSKLLLPYYRRSEFAGLTLEEQSRKIRASWQLFEDQRIQPEVWVAPAHSFDLLTLRAIHKETSIRVVCDGIAFDTFYENDFHWIPQQLWRLEKRRSGTWTVCLHPNQMNEDSIGALGRMIGDEYSAQMIGVKDVKLRLHAKSILDRVYHSYFWWRWKIRYAQ